MTEAFPLVKGATCVMRGNGKTLPVREGITGDVRGEVYADVGPVLLKLVLKADGSYEDHQGRIWDVAGIDRCPICAEPFRPEDICASDIELLTVHAECLDGCEVVDLETGEPTDKPLSTFPYSDVMEHPSSQSRAMGLHLTEAQIEEIQSVASRMDTSPENVLKRAIGSYCAKFGGDGPIGEPDETNVVAMRDAVASSVDSGEKP